MLREKKNGCVAGTEMKDFVFLIICSQNAHFETSLLDLEDSYCTHTENPRKAFSHYGESASTLAVPLSNGHIKFQ